MGKIEQNKEKRFQYLHLLWEKTDGSIHARENGNELGDLLGYPREETVKIVQYLVDEYLVKRAGLSFLIEITHEGIKEIEEALSSPDEPTHYFPPVNIINIHHMEGSQIQQGTVSSSQSGSFITENKNDIETFLNILKNKLPDLNLGVDDKTVINSDIDTVEAQLSSSRPKSSIVKESLKSIQRILEGASGALVAQQLIPSILSLLALLK